MPSGYGSGFTDPHILPERRYRIPPVSRVIPGLGAMALGIARTAIETFNEIAGAKTPQRTTQMLRENMMPKFASPTRSRSCSRPGSSCSTAWIGSGAPSSQQARPRWKGERMSGWLHRSRFERRAGCRPSLRRSWGQFALHELPAGTSVSRHPRDHAAHVSHG